TELEKKGYIFNSKTDTEVILASYLEWGLKCINKFNGMWAFCIYDIEKRILFCSRDRLGVKPLYYFFDGKRFIFCSEIKGILEHKYLNLNTTRNIDNKAIDFYFSIGFVPSPYSIYKNVFKLEARQNLIFNLVNKKIRKWYYYSIPDYSPIYDKKELIAEGKKILKDSVRLRMRADVPVGAFLSGGPDSSTIVRTMGKFCCLKNIHTFSIGFEGDYDETPYINIVKDILGTNHHHKYFTEKDFNDTIQDYASIYDEPFADYSGFPTYHVSKMAKGFVSVVLGGDGGDEVFGGYLIYQIGRKADSINRLPKPAKIIGAKIPIRLLSKIRSNMAHYKLLRKMGIRIPVNYLDRVRKLSEISLNKPAEFFSKGNLITNMMYKPVTFRRWSQDKLDKCLNRKNPQFVEGIRVYDLLYNTLADKYLTKVDRASMANAVEVRSPFLDYRFAEFSQKIPARWKVSKVETKILMREIIKDILPEKIVQRGKQGFTPPLGEWIQKEVYQKYSSKILLRLKSINKQVYNFYQKLSRNEEKIPAIYKIRLFLFAAWFNRWIK
ncbi:asparagine synthase (glutamine-hydrolyzing), partial [Patescibacteria group bacterium]|nr:asparagine synthase (glutamine-hydrolyzing) [Patescibacteria group bacterium]